jgi:flagellar FliJ protein
MKKFRFRLEMLLRHRQNVEEKERTKFSSIRQMLQAELGRLDELNASQDLTNKELARKKSGECDGREIAWYYRFLDRLSREIEASSRRISQLEQQLEEQRQIMVAASRDKKMLENLRKKQEQEFNLSLEREEQKSIDEMVVTRYAAKQ